MEPNITTEEDVRGPCRDAKELSVSLRNCLERVVRGPSEQLGPRRDAILAGMLQCCPSHPASLQSVARLIFGDVSFAILAGMLQERGLVRTVRHRDGTRTCALTPKGKACLAGMRRDRFGEETRRG